jgi:acetolactate synthase-1/2/3 large subunit
MNKPVILLGNGVRNNPALVDYLISLGVPILTTWMAADLVPENSPVFCGRPGIYGQRAANIIQQKATELACFGARLDEQQVAYRYDGFAPNAQKQVFDVDQAELDKLPKSWWTKKSNLNQGLLTIEDFDVHHDWLNWCKALYHRFRPELDGVEDIGFVDPFAFISHLSDYAQPDDIIVAGAGKAGETLMQAFKVKQGQRVQTLSTNGAMGYDIPLSIGACLASGRRVLCVTGDGGFQLNTQELEVVRRLHLPIQFFVHSNRGYGSIRMMQINRFDRRVVGADPESGFTIPKLAEIADCYGLEYQCVQSLEYPTEFTGQIIELMIDPDYIQLPRVATSMIGGKFSQDAMEDMSPLLPRGELKAIMEWNG